MERMAALGTTYYVDTELAMLVKLVQVRPGMTTGPIRAINGPATGYRVDLAVAGEELPTIHRSSQMTPGPEIEELDEELDT